MTWVQRPWTTKWSHSHDHSSPERRIRWVPLSPRKDTSKAWNWTRSGSAAYRFAFSILEMRLEFMSSSRSVFAPFPDGASGKLRRRAEYRKAEFARNSGPLGCAVVRGVSYRSL